MSADEIEWADPPTPTRGPTAGNRWDSVRKTLRSNPGRWALIKASAVSSNAYHWRKGSAGWALGDWEFRTVNTTAGRVDIYARYIGDGS